MAVRREIDKDEMFRKIMPSSYLTAENQPAFSNPPENIPTVYREAQVSPPTPEQYAQPSLAQEFSSLPETYEEVALPQGSPADLPEEIVPVNLAEFVIDRYYPKYAERLSVCTCHQCKDDVYGMALNQIQPRYLPNNMITDEALQERPLITEVVTQLLKALFKVKNNPRHIA